MFAWLKKLFCGDPESSAEREGNAHILTWHQATASSFADRKDVMVFRLRYKQFLDGGMSHKEAERAAFKYGDNGIGFWGHDTAQLHTPMVALPPEVWRAAGKRGGDPVMLEFNGRLCRAILGDTMPHLANITNGAGIDLNPAACADLGLMPPVMQQGVKWAWA
jgi:hypothetical protein